MEKEKNKEPKKIHRGYRSKEESLMAYIYGNKNKEEVENKEECEHVNISGKCHKCDKDMSFNFPGDLST